MIACQWSAVYRTRVLYTVQMKMNKQLRTLREQKKMSLRALSRKTGIAVSFLSALEKGRNNVSVSTLKTILDSFGTTLGEFFSNTQLPETKIVYRKKELTEISGQHSGISFREVAAGRRGRAIQLLVERYAPGADTGPKTYRHDAEEAGVILKGRLELTVDDEVYELGPGDAYYFDSRRPHRFRNAGKEPLEAISVNSPPSF
jgi:mannose-6-phosphate isomerase-like protein (cupin superfamily)